MTALTSALDYASISKYFIASFTRGHLLTTIYCSILVDKITARLRCWSSRALSYAARCILINSVLLSLHSYWANIFIIPKNVLMEITVVCRNYLWDGKPISTRTPMVSWEAICKPKCYGGLGIKDCYMWNIAAVGKYVWNIASKTDSLWLKWVSHVYLQGKDFWSYKPHKTASWTWKQICEVKDKLKGGYTGDIWSARALKGYSMGSGYTWLSQNQNKVIWQKWAWNRLNVPKHGFICWLAMSKRLRTKDRLYTYKICKDDTCPLCGQYCETADHLFFSCVYSLLCLEKIKYWISIGCKASGVNKIYRWLDKDQGIKFKKGVQIATITAAVYQIWLQRNSAVWNLQVQQPDLIVQRIKADVLCRVKQLVPMKISNSDRAWLASL
ncbi:uncharacterized protein [Spinacia oleracea]|uniref:Reverse transcriptase zinc-binding domain-containing protein n=1 Tax=Spinacia oleracea TaxID=3562 RepID=A0A9R0JTZ3_SPIOL|nr:uncharacterized protein LOC110786763 [Spinacia oleracea]